MHGLNDSVTSTIQNVTYGAILTVVYSPCVRWSALCVDHAHSRKHGTVGCLQVREGPGTARGAGAHPGTAAGEAASLLRRGGPVETPRPPDVRAAARC